MRHYRYVSACAVLCCGLALLFAACDSTQDDPTSTQADLQDFTYTYKDGSTIDVAFDASLTPERRTFETGEDYDAFLDEVRDSGTVTLNPEVWSLVGHALTPEEVSALDINRSVVIEGYLFEAEREAGYKTDTKGGPRELEVYYGESGSVDQEEFEEIMRNALEPEALSGRTFRDPSAQKLYESLISSEKGDPYIQRLGPYATVQLPFSSPTGTYPTSTNYSHQVGLLVGNQSTGSLWSKKAKGWSQVLFRPSGWTTWYGSYYGNYGASGEYLHWPVSVAVWGKGQSPSSISYFSATAEKVGRGESGTAEASRSSGNSARSFHWLQGRTASSTGSVYLPADRTDCACPGGAVPCGVWPYTCPDVQYYNEYAYYLP